MSEEKIKGATAGLSKKMAMKERKKIGKSSNAQR
jgi:hypothetical protein